MKSESRDARLLTVEQAATYLGCTVSDVEALMRDGRISRVRLWGWDSVDRQELDSLIDAAKVTVQQGGTEHHIGTTREGSGADTPTAERPRSPEQAAAAHPPMTAAAATADTPPDQRRTGSDPSGQGSRPQADFAFLKMKAEHRKKFTKTNFGLLEFARQRLEARGIKKSLPAISRTWNGETRHPDAEVCRELQAVYDDLTNKTHPLRARTLISHLRKAREAEPGA